MNNSPKKDEKSECVLKNLKKLMRVAILNYLFLLKYEIVKKTNCKLDGTGVQS